MALPPEQNTAADVALLTTWLKAVQPAAESTRLGIYAIQARLTRAAIKDSLNAWDSACDADVQGIIRKQIPGLSSAAAEILADHQEKISPQSDKDAEDAVRTR